jgi:RNA polymerase sigma-70 factor (ECF subfamily)
LTTAFESGCPLDVLGGEKQLAPARLESILAGHYATAIATWPALPIDDLSFVSHLARHIHGELDIERALASVHAADLYLALACGVGNHRALVELEKLFSALPDSLSRLANRAPPDEVLQSLRVKLLVATTDAGPKILDYAGRGPLAAWLRIAAIRTAVSLGRKSNVAAAAPVTREVLLGIAGVADDPEVLHLRDRCKDEFKKAFEDAIASLTAQERNVLRLNLIDRLSIDEIGALFRVHRATAARWIQRSLETIQQRTRTLLLGRLELAESELDSLMLLLRGSIELSVQRLLSESPEEPDLSTAPRRAHS